MLCLQQEACMDLAMTSAGSNTFEIGSFEAKTHFAELLRKVQEGAVISISKNGKQVAVLQGKQGMQNTAAMAAHRRILQRAARISAQRKRKGYAAITAKELKELKEYGRKY